jgi:hypothetical protein
MVADLQKEGGVEQVQLTLIASMEDLLESLRQDALTRTFILATTRPARVKLFRELLCAAEWTQEGDDRILEHLRCRLSNTIARVAEPSGRRVALLALARWSWKGDMSAHKEFVKYVEKYLTPSHLKKLQSLQHAMDLHVQESDSAGNPQVVQVMAAAITMGASQLDDSIGLYYWADIIAQMVPQGDLRAAYMLSVALQQLCASIRRIAALALQRLPWWSLRCTLAVLPQLAQGMLHKNGNVRHAALHVLTAVACRNGWCKGWDALSDKEVAVIQASLEPLVACLTDSMPKIRCAAWTLLPHVRAFVPHLRKANVPFGSHTCNSISTSKDGKAVSPGSTVSRNEQQNVLTGSMSQSRLLSQAQDSVINNVEGDESLSWCEEYYAIKGDRRIAIARSRLRLGKQLQWRSNKHHRNSAANPHRKIDVTKPKRKGGRLRKVSSRAFIESNLAKATLPRRDPSCELLCPMDLCWALYGTDPMQRDCDANSCGGNSWDFFSDCGYDPYNPVVYDPFAEEYDWWKAARSAKFARARIGKRSEIRRRPETSSRDQREKHGKGWKKVGRVVLISTESAQMADQRLPRKAACEHVHWQDVWSPPNAEAHDQSEADTQGKSCTASAVNFGCWLNLSLLAL